MSMGAAAMMPRLRTWSAAEALGMFMMWAIMMVGMMVPSASPMVLLYARVARRGHDTWGGYIRTALFVVGYIAVWTAFSALATAAQWALEELALLTPMLKTASPIAGGVVLVAAGVYQLTPAKRACLEHCRTPFAFVTQHWRPGSAGAFLMGLNHGLYCLGCCWMLMALLFVVGVMNLMWVVIIAAFVLVEKIMPAGRLMAGASATALIAVGAYMAIGRVNLF
jgi:predicted metal-binding membrane protein